MADKKISQLTNLTGANLAENDEFVLVDTSADETKAITFGELKTAFDTGTGFVRVTGDTMTGNLTVPTVDINGGTIDGTVIGGTTPAAGNFTGIDVTGTVIADSANITGTVTADGLTVDGAASAQIVLNEGDTTDLNTRIINNTGKLSTQTWSDAGGLVGTRMLIDHSTGDISFYEDTGTTPKFFWDASAEALGIGTTSPALQSGGQGLHAHGVNYSEIKFTNTTTGSAATDGTAVVSSGLDFVINNREAGTLQFRTSNTERMRIDSSGHAIIPAGVTLGTAAGVYNAANTLDDYEEGTWTPVVTAATGTLTTVTISHAVYTKIGQMVSVHTKFVLTDAGTGSGSLNIEGFPFAINTSYSNGVALGRNVSNTNLIFGQLGGDLSKAALIRDYDNTDPIVTGHTYTLTATYGV